MQDMSIVKFIIYIYIYICRTVLLIFVKIFKFVNSDDYNDCYLHRANVFRYSCIELSVS